MGTSRSQPNDWMTKNGTGKITTFADERGWCIRHANGYVEVLHAMGGVVEDPAVAATILSVLNPASQSYSIGSGDSLSFTVNWSEPVEVTGTPQIAFGISGDEADLTPVFTNDAIASVTVNDGGVGYVAQGITFDAPNKVNSTATVTITESGGVIDGVTLIDGGYGYEAGTIAVVGGNSDATVDITVTDGVIDGVTISDGGTGYSAGDVDLADPTLTVTTAEGSLTINAGAVTAVVMSENGYGYDGTEGYTLDSNAVAATADYVAADSSELESVFTYDAALAGTVGGVTEAVQLNSGTIVGADPSVSTELTMSFTDFTVDSVAIVSSSAGFAETETITFDAPNLSNSTATVTVAQTGGVIDSLTLVDGGFGYEDGQTIAVTGGNADATADITVVDGVITAVVLNAAGTGYSDATVNLAAPTLSVTTATADLVFTDGAITEVTMTEVGYGYDGTEGYTLSSTPNNNAILDFNAGYTQPTGVTIVA